MVTSYAMLANQGKKVDPFIIKRIEDEEGSVLYDYSRHSRQQSNKQIISKEIAYLMSYMLNRVWWAGTAAGARYRYNAEFDAYTKTGTSQEYRDFWLCGYVPEVCTSVWIGHDSNITLRGAGGSTAGPVWVKFMKEVNKKIDFSTIEYDPSLRLFITPVCRDSGLIPTAECYENNRVDRSAAFFPGTEPGEVCDFYEKMQEGPKIPENIPLFFSDEEFSNLLNKIVFEDDLKFISTIYEISGSEYQLKTEDITEEEIEKLKSIYTYLGYFNEVSLPDKEDDEREIDGEGVVVIGEEDDNEGTSIKNGDGEDSTTVIEPIEDDSLFNDAPEVIQVEVEDDEKDKNTSGDDEEEPSPIMLFGAENEEEENGDESNDEENSN